jgi:Flp pilus assembly protein TadG
MREILSAAARPLRSLAHGRLRSLAHGRLRTFADGRLRSFAHSRLRSFARDRRGVSAVEFAILLPLMLTLLIVGNEVGQAVTIYRKVSHTASTLGDLVAQVATVNSSDMSNIFDASTAIFSPYPASGAIMVVSAVNYTTANGFKVAWSQARNGSAWTKGATPPVTMPASLAVDGQQMIVARVTFTYTSVFSKMMTDIWGSPSITLNDIAYLRPRVSQTVTCTASGC